MKNVYKLVLQKLVALGLSGLPDSGLPPLT
jgi:hypothetical protein